MIDRSEGASGDRSYECNGNTFESMDARGAAQDTGQHRLVELHDDKSVRAVLRKVRIFVTPNGRSEESRGKSATRNYIFFYRLYGRYAVIRD